MVTNGVDSFTIFIYRRGDAEWFIDNKAIIGFGAGSEFASNHRLSGTPKVTYIACSNIPRIEFFTLLYKLIEPRYGK